MTLVLETERLQLRDAEDADAPFIAELLNSPGFLENIGDRGVRSLEDAHAYIEDRLRRSYREQGFGMWICVQKTDGRSVGMAGLVRREGLDTPDLGYAFLQVAWGQGYAQEAAAAVLQHATRVLSIPQVSAITTLENFASMAVLRKIGFAYRGVIQLPGIERENTHFTCP